MKNRTITSIALLSALAILFGYIESMLPPISTIPGIKLGLSNIVILFALFRYSKKTAFFIMLVKVFVSSLLFSGMNVLFYSLGGGVLSLIAMIFFRKLNLSIIGISISGAVFHNIGQLLVAAVMLGSTSVFYYFSVLLLSAIIVGFLTGTVCRIILSRLDLLTK